MTGIDHEGGRVKRVRTERGDIDAETVVIAAGMFSAEVGRLAGVRIPIQPMSHEFIVTQPFRERDPQNPLPTLRDPDLLIYFREDGGGLVMGGYERPSAPAFLADERGFERIPPDFNGRLLEDDWDRFEEIVVNSRRRVPEMENVKVTRMINGPEGFTPDNEFCLGETEIGGLFVAAGFCAHGLAGAGGIGKVMAEWIAAGEPSLDLWHMDIRRFGAQYRSPAYSLKRIRETYETYYDIKYPHHEREAGRPLRVSPANAWHREHDAAFGEKSGWERVNWYESNARAGDEALRPRGWAGRHWSPAIGAEHRACREAAALFDESSFAKLEIAGPGAAELLERLCDNQVAREVGRVTYTQMLNSRGGIECDFTGGPARRGALRDRHRHGIRQPRPRVDPPPPAGRRLGPGAGRDLRLGLPRDLGPARARRARPAHAPVARQRGLPLHERARDHRRRRAGAAPARDLRRRAGLGALLPAEYGLGLWRALWEAGRPHGLVAGGYRAIDSLRLEKGYRVWGADITPDETPYEGGLGFCVKLDKQGGFIGREALAEAAERGPRASLCLPHSRGPALGRAGQRARANRGRGRRPGHHGRLRLHRGALDRLRVPAPRARRARNGGGGRDLRALDRRRGVARAAPGSGRQPSARLVGLVGTFARKCEIQGPAGRRRKPE